MEVYFLHIVSIRQHHDGRGLQPRPDALIAENFNHPTTKITKENAWS